MKSKHKHVTGISIDQVLVVLLVLLVLSMIARAVSQDLPESETGLRVFDSYAEAAL